MKLIVEYFFCVRVDRTNNLTNLQYSFWKMNQQIVIYKPKQDAKRFFNEEIFSFGS